MLKIPILFAQFLLYVVALSQDKCDGVLDTWSDTCRAQAILVNGVLMDRAVYSYNPPIPNFVYLSAQSAQPSTCGECLFHQKAWYAEEKRCNSVSAAANGGYGKITGDLSQCPTWQQDIASLSCEDCKSLPGYSWVEGSCTKSAHNDCSNCLPTTSCSECDCVYSHGMCLAEAGEYACNTKSPDKCVLGGNPLDTADTRTWCEPSATCTNGTCPVESTETLTMGWPIDDQHCGGLMSCYLCNKQPGCSWDTHNGNCRGNLLNVAHRSSGLTCPTLPPWTPADKCSNFSSCFSCPRGCGWCSGISTSCVDTAKQGFVCDGEEDVWVEGGGDDLSVLSNCPVRPLSECAVGSCEECRGVPGCLWDVENGECLPFNISQPSSSAIAFGQGSAPFRDTLCPAELYTLDSCEACFFRGANWCSQSGKCTMTQGDCPSIHWFTDFCPTPQSICQSLLTCEDCTADISDFSEWENFDCGWCSAEGVCQAGGSVCKNGSPPSTNCASAATTCKECVLDGNSWNDDTGKCYGDSPVCPATGCAVDSAGCYALGAKTCHECLLLGSLDNQPFTWCDPEGICSMNGNCAHESYSAECPTQKCSSYTDCSTCAGFGCVWDRESMYPISAPCSPVFEGCLSGNCIGETSQCSCGAVTNKDDCLSVSWDTCGWCDDGDGGGTCLRAGVDEPVLDSGGDCATWTSSCGVHTSCTSCSTNDQCQWNLQAMRCMQGAMPITIPCSEEACQEKTTCSECQETIGCGWCDQYAAAPGLPSRGCVMGSAGGPSGYQGGSCLDWYSLGGPQCPAPGGSSSSSGGTSGSASSGSGGAGSGTSSCSATSCVACTNETACGWCSSSSKCFSGGKGGPATASDCASSSWQFATCGSNSLSGTTWALITVGSVSVLIGIGYLLDKLGKFRRACCCVGAGKEGLKKDIEMMQEADNYVLMEDK